MSIASQLPVVSQAQSASMLRALALTPGQTVEGRVLGPGLDGSTMVQVGRQALSLALPSAPPVGTVLTLAVQQAEGQLRLALLSQPQQPPSPLGPATSVEISRQAPQQAPLTYGPPVAAPAIAATPAGAVAAAVPAMAAVQPAGGAGPAVSPALAPVDPAIPPAPPGSQATMRPQAAPYGASTGLGLSTPPPAPASPPPAGASAGQMAALGQMVQQALPAQSSLGALTGVLSAAIGHLAMPEPVLKAARQILDNQLVSRDGSIDPAALKTAIRNSGLFQESMLARGMAAEAATDTKSGLLALRQSLGQLLGNQAPLAQVSSLPPPLRHVHPRARQPELLLPILPSDPEDMARLLLERTEGALSRLRLHQHASLPEANRAADSQWSMDLPVIHGGQQAIVHLQIHQDAASENASPEERGWQVRFAVNLPVLGEVGAQISLRGQHVGIMLWADRGETAAGFAEDITQLKAALADAGLVAGALVVRRGAPNDAHAPAASGQYLDAVR